MSIVTAAQVAIGAGLVVVLVLIVAGAYSRGGES
jgi:hypothetical protein